MQPYRSLLAHYVTALLLCAQAMSCGVTGEPTAGTQTNWLAFCESDLDCGDLQCECGTCTRTCQEDADCGGLPDAMCAATDGPQTTLLCSEFAAPTAGLCIMQCPEEGCPFGSRCVSGGCVPAESDAIRVTIDDTQRFQSLIGIGSAIGYTNDVIAEHPRKEEVLDAMFADSGFDILRVRNRFTDGDDADLASTVEIVAGATERLGRTPTIFLSSTSPPGRLKANDSSWCEGNPETCTLARDAGGRFDYASLAEFWRSSLDAYAEVGIEPDYIAVQNNPDFVPEAGTSLEACRFLPREGTQAIATDSGTVTVEYPGYAEALEALRPALQGLDSPPQIVAPETSGYLEVRDYVAAVDVGDIHAIGHHLYQTDSSNLDMAVLDELRALGESTGRPLFQSEMSADALTTATLLHASLAIEGAAVYIHHSFTLPPGGRDPSNSTLLLLTDDGFVVEDTYHVIRHYSGHIGSGWVRTAVDTASSNVMASAWLSPEDAALVIVLTNTTSTELSIRIDGAAWAESRVTRTTLGTDERSAELGPLAPDGFLSLPSHSIATVSLNR